jgi:hypothetical protein
MAVAVPPVNEETQVDPETKHTAGVALVHATPLVIWLLLLSGEYVPQACQVAV